MECCVRISRFINLITIYHFILIKFISSGCSADRLVSKQVLATPQRMYAIVHEVHTTYLKNGQEFASTDGDTLITTVYKGYGNLLRCSISRNPSQIEKLKSWVKKASRRADDGARTKSKDLLNEPIYRSNLGLMVNMKGQYQKCRRWKKMGEQHTVQHSQQEKHESVKLANRPAAFIMYERWCDGHVPGTALRSALVHNCCRMLRRCVRENGKDKKVDRTKCQIFAIDYPSLLNCECNRKMRLPWMASYERRDRDLKIASHAQEGISCHYQSRAVKNLLKFGLVYREEY